MSIHEAGRTLLYTPEQVFDLVADVERYPAFLPGWVAARIVARDGDVWRVDQVVRFAYIRYRFETRSIHDRPRRIAITAADHGPFRRLRLIWLIDPLPDGGCRASLRVDIALRSALIQTLVAGTLDGQVAAIVSAFEARAHRLFGAAPET